MDQAAELRGDVRDAFERIDAIKEKVSEMNGSIERHGAKIEEQERVNRTTAESLCEITDDVGEIKEYAARADGSMRVIKWMFGFLAGGGGLAILKLFSK